MLSRVRRADVRGGCPRLRTTGISRNWMIDAGGVWRFDEVGDREGDGDRVADTERMIEEARNVQAAHR